MAFQELYVLKNFRLKFPLYISISRLQCSTGVVRPELQPPNTKELVLPGMYSEGSISMQNRKYYIVDHYTKWRPEFMMPATELYYISGDCALIPRQSTNCNQKHEGFWQNLRHFEVTVSLFSCRTPLTRYLSGKNLSTSRGQWMAP